MSYNDCGWLGSLSRSAEAAPARKDGWAALLRYYRHIYLETVGRVLEVRNHSSQRLVPSLRKRRRTTMGHLTVMKSTGTRWQIHLEPWRQRERRGGWMERDRQAEWGAVGRQLGRKGRQWQHWFSNKNRQTCRRQSGVPKIWGDSQFDSAHTTLPDPWLPSVNNTLALFPHPAAGPPCGPVMELMLITVPGSAARATVWQQPSGMLGNPEMQTSACPWWLTDEPF